MSDPSLAGQRIPPPALELPALAESVDTEESARMLGYQTRTFDDVVRETAALLGWRRPLARLLRPVVRAAILRMSPAWRARGR